MKTSQKSPMDSPKNQRNQDQPNQPKIISPRFEQPDVPRSEAAEENLLGALLIDPKRLDEVSFLEPSDFFLISNRYIYETLLECKADGKGKIDLVIVSEALRRKKRLDEIEGGLAGLTLLVSQCPTSAHAAVYARMVQRVSARRKLMQLGTQMRRAAQDESTDTAATLADYQAELQGIAAPLAAQQGLSAREAMDQHITQVGIAMRSERPKFVATGWNDMDVILGGGFYPRRLTYVAGINHHGKTSVLITCAHYALLEGMRVAYMNVADGNEKDVMDRMLAMESGLAPLQLQSGDMENDDYALYRQATDRISNTRLHIASEKAMPMPTIYGHCAGFKSQQGGLDVVFIDYFQRIGALGSYTDNRHKLNKISQVLTTMAETLDCPVVCAAQVVRGVQGFPTRFHIQGTGHAEQDADVVLIVYKEETTPVPGADRIDFAPVQLKVDKNKVTGRTGIVNLVQDTRTTKLLPTVKRNFD